ncbi:dihydrolipoamide acetyltransferase family protein [Saccharopolyspora flava]|uniref:Dihydrolipoamide acetyltransferase component of pyruvate dehydrogenase complex n=1 Tax=Saccharopolyspora flava TaxID=95161 RepID=A0A1I6T9N2_9PSEU|nr:dihydrolipoamide acetyltransferase family protein [Saccharopolyspora flava]SFS85667.1 pyruvate dehydrogenase E2 component (dihydrolipoamide acetyltransferase) [Saccharopolyspora flava]
MALKKFPLPDVGEGLTEAEIVGWKVQAGENVTVNQVIVEIETAKASVELPCPWAGTIRELLVEPGQTVEVGTPIISIEMAGAEPEPEPEPQESSGKIGEESNGRIATLVGYGPRTSSAKRRPRKDRVNGAATGGAATNGTGANGGGTATVAPPEPRTPQVEEVRGAVPLAKPPVRKLAKDLGVDLRSLAGSGTGGVITREDVRTAATPSASTATPVATPSGARERRVPIKGVRKATAQAMVDSAFTAPHVTEFLTVDVTPMMELREQLKSDPAFRGVKITPLAFAAKAMCLAARRTPDVNATWDEAAGEIVYKDYVHLGVAAATPRGLVVPKVRDADGMSLRELAEALEQLTNTARDGKTAPADMVGGTITITNVGVFGVDTGTPIINPGESAILAFGAIRDMPWVVDGQVVPRKVCQLALSFDHRVVDGQQGSQYLADVGALLANPSLAFTY